jgi:pilus assembly protein Flp/PilA
MLTYLQTWISLRNDRRAVTALEYGLVAAILVGTVALGFGALSNSLSGSFVNIGTSL